MIILFFSFSSDKLTMSIGINYNPHHTVPVTSNCLSFIFFSWKPLAPHHMLISVQLSRLVCLLFAIFFSPGVLFIYSAMTNYQSIIVRNKGPGMIGINVLFRISYCVHCVRNTQSHWQNTKTDPPLELRSGNNSATSLLTVSCMVSASDSTIM